MDAKAGLSKAAAFKVALELAKRVARRAARTVRCEADRQVVLSGAYEGVVRAWACWQPERGPWEPHAVVWATTYAERERHKLRSVVSTASAYRRIRQIESDAAVVSDSGEEIHGVQGHEALCEARSSLVEVFHRWQSVVDALPSRQARVGRALIEQIRTCADLQSVQVAQIAAACEVTPPVVYAVRARLLAAAREQRG